MEVNRMYHIMKSFALNKYYYTDDWFVDGKINVMEVFYLQPTICDDIKFNIHINSTNPRNTNVIINKCICDNGIPYKYWSLNRNNYLVNQMNVNINIDKLIKLLEENGYVDNNIKQKEIFLNENFHLKPNDYKDE